MAIRTSAHLSQATKDRDRVLDAIDRASGLLAGKLPAGFADEVDAALTAAWPFEAAARFERSRGQ